MANGKIGVTSHDLFPIIKKFLYSDHDIFLREIVSNAVDATQKLRTLAATGEYKGDVGKLFVGVAVDKEAKTITISDRGIGMTEEEVGKYINQIAFSGAEEFLDKYKDDANAIIGHFGLGFYSSFMISEKVDIITKSYREDSQAVMWSCDGTPEYTLENVDKADRGTDIVMHVSEEEIAFLDESKIGGLLDKYCKFLPIDIVFGKKKDWKDGKEVVTEEDNIINDTNPAWTKKPADLTDETYNSFYKQLYPMGEDPLFHIHLNVDYPFNLTGILYFPKLKNNIEIQKNKIQLYSNQVFVTDSVEGIVPEFLTLLHGVIDSPDIPLNVSRSYLQTDGNVKKISNHITKKVADSLFDIYKKDRKEYDDKWSDLKVFVQYGMLTNEKFAEKATKFVMLQNTDKKCFTVEEYETLIKANQTDKDGNIVALYTTDLDAQYSYIEAAKDRGYDVLVMDGQLDTHFVNHMEQKDPKKKYVRVDADIVDKLIVKDNHKASTLSEKETSELSPVFMSRLKMNQTQFNVTFEALGETASPVIITQSEFMRRMKEMSAMQPGMNMYGAMPDSYNLVVNSDHKLVDQLILDKNSALEKEISPLSEKISTLESKKAELEKAKEGKKEEEVSQAEKDELSKVSDEVSGLNTEKSAKLEAFGKDSKVVGQLIDLALLANGLLKGEALAKFVRRSVDMIK
ncbi:MAG: molecular chaperone HtpG [Marinifilaceae bacterium]